MLENLNDSSYLEPQKIKKEYEQIIKEKSNELDKLLSKKEKA